MMEHVGREYLDEYMEAVAKTLRPGGCGVFQWISKTKQGEVTPWVRNLFFQECIYQHYLRYPLQCQPLIYVSWMSKTCGRIMP